MHQGRALKSVTRAFLLKVIMRHAAEFVINQRNRRAQSLHVTGVPVR